MDTMLEIVQKVIQEEDILIEGSLTSHIIDIEEVEAEAGLEIIILLIKEEAGEMK